MPSGALTVHSGCFKSSECPTSPSGHRGAPTDLQTPRLPSSAWCRPKPPLSMCSQGNFCVAISAILNTQPRLWDCLLGGPPPTPCLTIRLHPELEYKFLPRESKVFQSYRVACSPQLAEPWIHILMLLLFFVCVFIFLLKYLSHTL